MALGIQFLLPPHHFVSNLSEVQGQWPISPSFPFFISYPSGRLMASSQPSFLTRSSTFFSISFWSPFFWTKYFRDLRVHVFSQDIFTSWFLRFLLEVHATALVSCNPLLYMILQSLCNVMPLQHWKESPSPWRGSRTSTPALPPSDPNFFSDRKSVNHTTEMILWRKDCPNAHPSDSRPIHMLYMYSWSMFVSTMNSKWFINLDKADYKMK